jgi:Lon protease-like protein
MSDDGAPSEDRSSGTGQRVEMLPIFPLPSVVLFPFVRVPLFIFEPRYRQMIKIAIERDGVIGMVTVVPDEIEMMAGDPAVRAIEEYRAQVHAQYTTLLEREAPEFHERFRSGQLDAIPNSVYVNSIAVALDISTLEKQSLLDCPSTFTRFERLLAVLDFKLAEPRLHSIANPTSLQ